MLKQQIFYKHMLKSIIITLSLLTAPLAGMLRKVHCMRDGNTIGAYTDAKMIIALRYHNIPRINSLLRGAAYYRHYFKTSPIGPKVITEAINIDHNPIKIVQILLDLNAPLDEHAIPRAIDLNDMGLLQVGEIKNLIELLLAHKAPLSTEAIEKALTWDLDDYVELLLQHNAPISDTAIDLALKNKRFMSMELFVKYNPAMYKKIISGFINCPIPRSDVFLDLIVYYLDNHTLKEVNGFHVTPQRKDFIQWLNTDNASLEMMPQWKNAHGLFATMILEMPKIRLPYDFSLLLQHLAPRAIEMLFDHTTETVLETNQSALKSLITFWVDHTTDANIIKHGYPELREFNLFKNKPSIYATILNELYIKQMSAPLKHTSKYDNVRFIFE